MKLPTLDIFTMDEIDKAIALNDHDKIMKEIVQPAMPRINKATGQENDARYFAYALEYVISQMER